MLGVVSSNREFLEDRLMQNAEGKPDPNITIYDPVKDITIDTTRKRISAPKSPPKPFKNLKST